MNHNASKLIVEHQDYVADLSCEELVCLLKIYSEAKVFNLKLGSYKLHILMVCLRRCWIRKLEQERQTHKRWRGQPGLA
ncbi:uncharacterized protein M6B38_201385 [Iris pallida]|uniref:Uncharacterized protein n=1 Tax=Iris pallida TaxID=29817 RepID=A0AAX6E9D3_IRIPA|nr:uncharacterized protein M6B38_201385 [Iris pallida]